MPRTAAQRSDGSEASTVVSHYENPEVRSSGASTDSGGSTWAGGAAEERQYSYNINAAMLFNKIENFGTEEENMEITRRENEIVADSSRNSITTIIASVQNKNAEAKVQLDAIYQRQKNLIENNILEPFTVSDANPEEEKEQNINNFNLLILCLYLSRNNIAEMYKDLGLGAQYKYEDNLTQGIRDRNALKNLYDQLNKDVINNADNLKLRTDIYELFSKIEKNTALVNYRPAQYEKIYL